MTNFMQLISFMSNKDYITHDVGNQAGNVSNAESETTAENLVRCDTRIKIEIIKKKRK